MIRFTHAKLHNAQHVVIINKNGSYQDKTSNRIIKSSSTDAVNDWNRAEFSFIDYFTKSFGRLHHNIMYRTVQHFHFLCILHGKLYRLYFFIYCIIYLYIYRTPLPSFRARKVDIQSCKGMNAFKQKHLMHFK